MTMVSGTRLGGRVSRLVKLLAEVIAWLEVMTRIAWAGGPDYDERIEYFSSRNLLRGFRVVVSGCAFMLCCITIALMFTPGDTTDYVLRAGGIFLALFWTVRWHVDPVPSGGTALIFTLTSIAGVFAVCLSHQEVMTGAFGLCTMGMLSTFAAFMLPPRHFLVTALAMIIPIGVFSLRMMIEYGIVTGAVKTVLLIATTIVVPATVQFGMAFLSQDAADSDIDALTGVLNRRGLRNVVITRLRFGPPGAIDVGVLVVDLDGFKGINDAHGHAAGDAELVRVADVLRATAAEVGGVVARIGGDEFALLVLGGDHIQCRLLADRIRATIAAGSVGSMRVTASIGVSVTPVVCGRSTPMRVIDPVLDCADAAMYAAKKNGDCIVVTSDAQAA